ncbi:MAG: hypothetical protein EXR71_16715 [Myxococcales bacterium]|nr:hypothetical protein [Myxococcales bacterium]
MIPGVWSVPILLPLLASAFAQEPAPGVPVHLDIAQAGVRVDLVDETRIGFHIQTTTRVLCETTCDVVLEGEQALIRYTGRGRNPGERRLTLRANQPLAVRGRLGSKSVTGVGIGLGAAGSAFSLGVAVVQLVAIGDFALTGDSDPAYTNLATVGRVATVTGLGVGALLVVSSLSHVHVEPAHAPVTAWLAPNAAGISGSF